MWKRVIGPTVVVTGIWLVVSGFVLFYINWLERSYQRVLVENVSSIEGDADLQRVVWRSQAELGERISASHVTNLRMEADSAVKTLRESASLPGEAQLAMDVSMQKQHYI